MDYLSSRQSIGLFQKKRILFDFIDLHPGNAAVAGREFQTVVNLRGEHTVGEGEVAVSHENLDGLAVGAGCQE